MDMEIHSAPYINEPKLYSLRISCDCSAGLTLSWRHTGDFMLGDCDEVELEIGAVRLVRKK